MYVITKILNDDYPTKKESGLGDNPRLKIGSYKICILFILTRIEVQKTRWKMDV